MKQITNFQNSAKYREFSHSLIPGGAHTYSKGDGQFPDVSPAAITRGEGCYLWDVDNNKYLDCSMGLGSVTLGHAFSPINDKVIETIKDGINFQRPSFLEVEAAKAFLSVVDYHDMIKFAKNGSTVTTAAVKLARAHTGRKLVAFPSDHPFYSYDDWFIGKSACRRGIPQEIQDLSINFKSYDIEELKNLFNKYPNEIACVITEPQKHYDIPETYLKEAIELCHKHGALFIADEMVSGFKSGFPGICNQYNVVPDLATWGKGTANGFSFCALTGKKEIMNLGGVKNTGEEFVFLISTTHGGETHALRACIETIKFYKENNVIEKNHKIGNDLIKKCREVILNSGLEQYIEIFDCPWLVIYNFKDKNGEVSSGLRTLFLQEMIKRGVLFQGCFVPSFSHTTKDIDFLVEAFKDSLQVYSKALKVGYDSLLTGVPIKPVFRKYV